MRVFSTAAFACAAMLAGQGVAHAQSAAGSIEGRVGRLESEMRAVQRKVFPGGAGATLEPQITSPARPADAPGVPASSALADLTTRVNTLESNLRTLTGQVEQSQFRLKQLEDGFAAYKRETDAKLTALTPGADTTGNTAVAVAPAASTPPATTTKPAVGVTPAKPASATTAANPQRAAALAAVERPATDDPAEDAYLYGFRLWEAKLYPEAQKELKAVADKYPKHRRASFAQNLLGRAYLDEGKPSLASLAFYDSYKKFPDGERAPDSLFYLSQALVQLKKPAADVCKVYTELTDVYGAKMSAKMKSDVEKGRAAQKCS